MRTRIQAIVGGGRRPGVTLLKPVPQALAEPKHGLVRLGGLARTPSKSGAVSQASSGDLRHARVGAP
jgi:hypothetical protein